MVDDEVEKLRDFRESLRQFADTLIRLLREADRLEAALAQRPKRQESPVKERSVQPMVPELPPTKLAYTLTEVVKATGIGRTTLYRLRQSGDLVFWKCGGKTLIKAAELHRWLASMPMASIGRNDK